MDERELPKQVIGNGALNPEAIVWNHGVMWRIYDEAGGIQGYMMDCSMATNGLSKSAVATTGYSSEDLEAAIAHHRQIEKKWRKEPDIIPSGEKYPTTGILNALPVEFFNHQLDEVDAENEEKLFAFLNDWGFPYSPLRDNPHCADVGYGALRTQSIKGVRETNQVWDEGISAVCFYISKLEATSTLLLMKEATRQLREALLMEDRYEVYDTNINLEPINAASSNSYRLMSNEAAHDVDEKRSGRTLQDVGQLTSAIANQIIYTVMEPYPWKLCACKGCGRYFKNKQSGRIGVDSKAIYCSSKCETRQGKRNQRSAAKSRIQH